MLLSEAEIVPLTIPFGAITIKIVQLIEPSEEDKELSPS